MTGPVQMRPPRAPFSSFRSFLCWLTRVLLSGNQGQHSKLLALPPPSTVCWWPRLPALYPQAVEECVVILMLSHGTPPGQDLKATLWGGPSLSGQPLLPHPRPRRWTSARQSGFSPACHVRAPGPLGAPPPLLARECKPGDGTPTPPTSI